MFDWIRGLNWFLDLLRRNPAELKASVHLIDNLFKEDLLTSV